MTKFIGRGILFSVGLALIFALLLWINRLLSIPPYRCGEGIDTVITGDSQVQYGVDDRRIAGARNIALQSESYLHSYIKLNHVFRHNPGVGRVVLGFSYHSLSSYYDDEYITGKYAETIMTRFYGIMDASDIARVLARQPSWSLSAIKALMTCKGHPFIGTFPAAAGSGVDEGSLKKRIEKQYYLNGRVRGLSGANPVHLRAIVRLCRDRGTELVLLTTPLHPAYRLSVPRTFLEAYRREIDGLRLPVLDLQDFELPGNCYLQDGDHLTAEGAALAARELDRRLNAHREPPRPL